MNGDDLTPLDELASAYLDAEVTPDERAAAEADPMVVARADQFAQLRGLLAETDLAAFDTESLIAGALGTFDDAWAPDATVVATPPPPASAQVIHLADRRSRRRPTGWWTGLAAAAVMVGGVVIVSRAGGNDTGSEGATQTAAPAALAPAASEAPAAEADAFTVEEAAARELEIAEPTVAAAALPAEAGLAPEVMAAAPTEAPAATEASAADEAPAATEAPAPSEAGSIDGSANPADAAASGVDDLIVFNSEEQIRFFVPSVSSVNPDLASLGRFASCPVDGEPVQAAAWQGVPGTLWLLPDRANPTEAAVLDDRCVELIRIVL